MRGIAATAAAETESDEKLFGIIPSSSMPIVFAAMAIVGVTCVVGTIVSCAKKAGDAAGEVAVMTAMSLQELGGTPSGMQELGGTPSGMIGDGSMMDIAASHMSIEQIY